MSKLIAIILWPYVYFLDLCIALIGGQTFQEARAISNAHFNRILSRDKKDDVSQSNVHENWFGLFD